MKERPILFSAPMVRALLAGKKTQTRRIIKRRDGELPVDFYDGMFWFADGDAFEMVCPHGGPGDRLWVRETTVVHGSIREQLVGYVADGCMRTEPWEKTMPAIHMRRTHLRIKRDLVQVRVERLLDISEEDAIAEGLSCVTKDGSLYKYGIPDRDGLPGTDDDGWPWDEWDIDPRIAYFKLWNKINGAGAASKNPWVWAVTMKATT